jgi:hypothetical protein
MFTTYSRQDIAIKTTKACLWPISMPKFVKKPKIDIYIFKIYSWIVSAFRIQSKILILFHNCIWIRKICSTLSYSQLMCAGMHIPAFRTIYNVQLEIGSDIFPVRIMYLTLEFIAPLGRWSPAYFLPDVVPVPACHISPVRDRGLFRWCTGFHSPTRPFSCAHSCPWI